MVDDYPEFLKLIEKQWSASADQELSTANHKGCHVLLPYSSISPVSDGACRPLAMHSVMSQV